MRGIPLGTKITVVLGNVSCDLDSAVSSVIYAFFLFWKTVKLSPPEERKDEDPIVYIPVLNIPRDDYKLKTEVTHLFEQYGITPDELVFRDEVNLELLHSKGQLKLIMVDHHILSTSDKTLASCVVQILDHRPKDINNWLYKDSTDVTIEPVGSCATLVGLNILADSFFGKRFLELTDASKFLYGAIILDTVNFSSTAARGSVKDLSMVEELENIMKLQNIVASRERTLNTLQAAKSKISHLTAEQLLRKDAKTVGPIFIPGFPLLVEEYLKKDNVKATLEKISEDETIKVILLLGVKICGENIERDLAVFSKRRYKKMALKLAEALKNSKTMNLELSRKTSTMSGVDLYKQNNLKATRKHIIPIVEDFLKKP